MIRYYKAAKMNANIIQMKIAFRLVARDYWLVSQISRAGSGAKAMFPGNVITFDTRCL